MRLEALEPRRVLAATISIDDAVVVESQRYCLDLAAPNCGGYLGEQLRINTVRLLVHLSHAETQEVSVSYATVEVSNPPVGLGQAHGVPTLDTPVSLTGNEIELIGLNTETTYALAFQGLDASGQTATWTVLGDSLQQDRMWLRLSDAVTDTLGRSLDGEWINPVNRLDPQAVQLPISGDGVAGGDFVFGFVVIPADGNQDWSVDTSDFNIWNDNKFTLNTAWLSGDYNGDGLTDASDWNLYNSWKFTTVAGLAWKDLNHDGQINAADIDHLYDAILGRRLADTFDDLNGDGIVDQADMDYFIFDLLQTQYGDLDLDGDVDLDDLNAWTPGATGWASGDVNGDGVVDLVDWGLIQDNLT